MTTFDEFDFAANPDPRCPVMLVLDCSASMAVPFEDGSVPLEQLNDGLDVLVSELNKDPLARRRVELSVVTFGAAVSPASEFATVGNVTLPQLAAAGLTPMGQALSVALDAVEERKRTYRANGISYYRPWVLLITDGLSTDDVTTAAQRIKAAEASKALAFFAVGIEGADLDELAKLGTRDPLKLRGLAFSELFVWLSASQSRVSASTPGDAVALPAPNGWADL